jgi:hypothetical protein
MMLMKTGSNPGMGMGAGGRDACPFGFALGTAEFFMEEEGSGVLCPFPCFLIND